MYDPEFFLAKSEGRGLTNPEYSESSGPSIEVVASQLSAEITKLLVLTDPYRIKAPAERIATAYHVPVGVQLLHVYVEQRQIDEMFQDANAERSYSSHLAFSIRKTLLNRKSLLKNNSKEQPISLMKRDTSRIFTVPEEVELESIHYSGPISSFLMLPTERCNSPTNRREDCKTENTKYPIPITPSVCSTPLKDVNRVLHGTAVSICSTTDEADTRSEITNKSEEWKKNFDDIPDIVKEALRCKQLNKLKNATSDEDFIVFKDGVKKSLSLNDIRKNSNRVLLRTSNLGLPKVDKTVFIDHDADITRRKTLLKSRFFNTIADPYYPVFRSDGIPVTHSLYNQCIAFHHEEFDQSSAIFSFTSDTLSPLPASQSKNEDFKNIVTLENNSKQEIYRRSMILPLKPLNVLDNEESRKSISECNSIFEMQPRRKLDGLQLTPLMSKLSLIPDERTSGFCSRETTPSDFRDLSSFSVTTNHLIKNKLEAVNKVNTCDDEIDADWITASKTKSSVEKIELFLCGHQNMVLVLLMENGMCSDPELIHSLWKTCIDNLGKLEVRLQQCLDPLPVTENKEIYSALTVDSEWDTTHRSGLWGVTELDIIATLHNRFIHANNLTDIIIRTEETVVYGNQSGNVEVYYQQAMSSNTSGGLPTPADLMGIVPLKAKRRVEKNHEIVLL